MSCIRTEPVNTTTLSLSLSYRPAYPMYPTSLPHYLPSFLPPTSLPPSLVHRTFSVFSFARKPPARRPEGLDWDLLLNRSINLLINHISLSLSLSIYIYIYLVIIQ